MRDEFSAPTIRILADRVNSICSNPTCRAQTRGPRSTSNTAINIGKAAHITAASALGPRYDPTLTVDERAHFNNGIWLCSTCADLIDTDPERYTVELMREWKREAETNAIIEIGRPRGFSKGRLALVSGAVPFGTETNVRTEKDGDIPIAHIATWDGKEATWDGHQSIPTYFESFGYVRRFKIKKRAKLKYIILDEIRVVVHGRIDIPEYRPLYGAYPTETSLYTVTIKPPAKGEVLVCTAERYYEVTERRKCQQKNFASLVIDDEIPHVVTVRFNAESPGFYFVSLHAILSRGMKQEVHTVMGPSPIIFEGAPVFDD